ncbi:MAG TPA: hypothetical protein DCS93_12380 [Microscillaceae bacterium]|nr:hypothetical protein [Microscillaceae bacterium]
MKKKIFLTPLLCLTFCLLGIKSYAQLPPPPGANKVAKKKERGEGVEKLKSLGRDALIKMGLDILKKEGLEVYDYKVSVVANQRTLIIHFYHPITYLPQHTICAGSHRLVFSSNKFQKRISYPYKHPFNAYVMPGKTYPAYRQTAKGKKMIKKMVATINRNDKARTQKLDLKTLDGNFVVQEQATYYEVSFVERNMQYDYKIEKTSGKIFYKEEMELPPPPPPIDGAYQEVKN